MDKSIAFLELKYGHIYGGSQWKKVVNDASVVILNPEEDRIRVYSKQFRGDVQVVLSNGVTDSLGITVGREFEVIDLNTKEQIEYDEKFLLPKGVEMRKQKEAAKLKTQLKQFMLGVMRYHNISELITYGGSRDITLCEQAGVRFNRIRKIEDTQRLLQKYTKHLFSLNMISKIIGFNYEYGWSRSNNCEYKINNRIATHMKENTATFDAVRAFMAHQEFTKHQQNMIIKAALQMQRIQDVQEARAAAKEKSS